MLEKDKRKRSQNMKNNPFASAAIATSCIIFIFVLKMRHPSLSELYIVGSILLIITSTILITIYIRDKVNKAQKNDVEI